mmetsp:Transcript_15995/g.41370  ORF Transcript_15995/g.41370 Transcript_15995/m.41370 type:complete len:761 (+) Transcript_15995:56-2338(+)
MVDKSWTPVMPVGGDSIGELHRITGGVNVHKDGVDGLIDRTVTSGRFNKNLRALTMDGTQLAMNDHLDTGSSTSTSSPPANLFGMADSSETLRQKARLNSSKGGPTSISRGATPTVDHPGSPGLLSDVSSNGVGFLPAVGKRISKGGLDGIARPPGSCNSSDGLGSPREDIGHADPAVLLPGVMDPPAEESFMSSRNPLGLLSDGTSGEEGSHGAEQHKGRRNVNIASSAEKAEKAREARKMKHSLRNSDTKTSQDIPDTGEESEEGGNRGSMRTHRVAGKGVMESIFDLGEQELARQAKGRVVVNPRTFRGRVVNVVQRQSFTAAISALVLLNAFYIGLETAMNICEEGMLGGWWYVAEVCFAAAFTSELSIRLFAERCYFFLDWWNIFDLVLVFTAVMDTMVLRHLAKGSMVDLFVVLRILRLCRLARIFRLIRFFRELWFLVEGILGATKTLGWAWLLLFFMIFVPAIFITRSVGQVYPENAELNEMFGTVTRSMYSLFQVLSIEGWAYIARTTMKEEPWSCAFFLMFMGSTTFAVMHIVVAVIVQNTLEHANQRNKNEQSSKDVAEKKAMMKIIEVFSAADVDGDGTLTKEEFIESLTNPNVITLLHEVDVDIRQAESLFEILDYDESGSLDATEFIEGVMTARGEAQSKEILSVQCDLWKAERRLISSISGFDDHLTFATDKLVDAAAMIREDMDDFFSILPEGLSDVIKKAAEAMPDDKIFERSNVPSKSKAHTMSPSPRQSPSGHSPYGGPAT